MQKEYIVDTNVLIDNPDAILILRNGEENNVHIPNHVLAELDNLKKDKIIGTNASIAIKKIEENKEWLRFIRNKYSYSNYTNNVDQLILNEINNDIDLRNKGILVTSDRLMRLNAESNNIQTNDFYESLPYLTDSEHHTGFFDSNIDEPVVNNFTWIEGKPYFFNNKQQLDNISHEYDVWGVKPKNIYQNLAFHLLMNIDLDIVTIQSQAGYGKTFLTLAAAMSLALEKKYNKYNKIVVTKSAYEFGKEMGSLPGNLDEKFAPSVRPIVDLVHKLDNIRPANKIFVDDTKDQFKKNKFEMLPLAYIQGMNIENSILIIDEAQNLSRKEMRGIATRCGSNTRLFAIGDTRQVNNPYINEHNNGLNWLVKLCQGQNNYGHIVLKGKQSRGPVTDTILKVGL